jgi:excisionase family DNA binding protein
MKRRVQAKQAVNQAPMTVSGNSIEDRWLSVDEIAAYLGIKRDTIYKWIDEKSMPSHRVGRYWKFRKDEVDTWVRSGGASSDE